MKISKELQKFIEEEIDTIELNTKESWREKYYTMDPALVSELTELMFEMGYNPAVVMGYVPAFYMEESLVSSLDFLDKVEYIGQEAFAYCHNLDSVIIPGNVKQIFPGAFSNCTELTHLTLSKGLESIFEDAFHGCEHLYHVEFDGTAEEWSRISISSTAFSRCSILSRIYCEDEVVDL